MGEAVQLKSLTGLRFFAAAAVFMQHLQTRLEVPNVGLNFAHQAVALFFVLSGFILTHVYAERLESGFSWRRFYITRWARIWPLHAICLLLCLGVFSFRSAPLPEFWPAQMMANIGLIQAWVPDADWALGFNSVSWSLSCEAFFYLLFPLIIWAGRSQIGWLLGANLLIQIAIVAALAVAGGTWEREYFDYLFNFNPFFRLSDFMVGILLGLLFIRQRDHRRSLPQADSPSRSSQPSFADNGTTLGTFVAGSDISDLKVTTGPGGTDRSLGQNSVSADRVVADTVWEFVIVGLILGLFFLESHFQLYYHIQQNSPLGIVGTRWLRASLPGPVLALLIWALAGRSGVLSQFLSWRPIEYLGEVSFAFYMVHQLVIRFLQQMDWRTTESFLLIKILVVFALSLALAVALYHSVEIPYKKLFLKLESDWNPKSPAVDTIEERTATPEGSPADWDPYTEMFVPVDDDGPQISTAVATQRSSTQMPKHREAGQAALAVLPDASPPSSPSPTDATADGRLVWQAVKAFAVDQWRFWFSGTAATVIVVVIIGAAAVHLTMQRLEPELAQVVAQSYFGRHSIVFEGEAKLHGLQLINQDDTWLIKMVWERLPGAQRKRSFHLCDEKKEIIGYLPQDRDTFFAAKANVAWLEELTIPKANLAGVDSIGIGFFSPELKGAPVSSGPRSQNNRRLDFQIPPTQ